MSRREVEQSWAVAWVFAWLKPVHLLKMIGLHPHLNMPVARISYIRHVVVEVFAVSLATGEQHTHRQVTTCVQIVFMLCRVTPRQVRGQDDHVSELLTSLLQGALDVAYIEAQALN